MADTYRGAPPDRTNGSTPNSGKGLAANDSGKTLLVGILGGIVSAAGYVVYQRLPDDQKQKLHGQVRAFLDERLHEIKQNFNF